MDISVAGTKQEAKKPGAVNQKYNLPKLVKSLLGTLAISLLIGAFWWTEGTIGIAHQIHSILAFAVLYLYAALAVMLVWFFKEARQTAKLVGKPFIIKCIYFFLVYLLINALVHFLIPHKLISGLLALVISFFVFKKYFDLSYIKAAKSFLAFIFFTYALFFIGMVISASVYNNFFS